jgi:diadenosine tetraphosphate (Ap4A) HIT family hydrolase
VTDNAYPYKAKKEHLLLIHKEHITSISEMTAPAWEELHTIINTECEKRNITGGTFLLRLGNTQETGASVNHLHCQIFQPDRDSPEYDQKTGVLVRIG